MPYAMVEDKIAEIAPQYRGELMAFIDFLLYRQKNSVAATDLARKSKSAPRRRKNGVRTLGGFEKGFYMAPDFDAPLECVSVQTVIGRIPRRAKRGVAAGDVNQGCTNNQHQCFVRDRRQHKRGIGAGAGN